VCRFALDRTKDFSYTEHTGILGSRLVIVDLGVSNCGSWRGVWDPGCYRSRFRTQQRQPGA
jgi:hypothetical protein